MMRKKRSSTSTVVSSKKWGNGRRPSKTSSKSTRSISATRTWPPKSSPTTPARAESPPPRPRPRRPRLSSTPVPNLNPGLSTSISRVRLAREKKRLIFSLNLIEGTLLRRAFEQLRAQYQLTPDELDPKTATAWYSSRGRQGSGMSVEDTRSWVEHLHQIKRAQVEKLEDWIRQITPAQPGPLH